MTSQGLVRTDITAAGIRALRRILIGKEASNAHGLLVIPTTLLVGNLSARMEQGIYQPDQLETGRLARYERSEIISRQAELSYESDATFQQIHHLLNMAIRDSGPNAAVTVGLHTWEPIYNAETLTELDELRNAPASYTFYYGDDRIQWKTGFVGCNQLEFNGQVGDVVKVRANLFGRDMEVLDNTSMSLPITSAEFLNNSTVMNDDPRLTLESVKVNQGKLFVIDHGMTPTFSATDMTGGHLPGTLVDFAYRIITGYSPQRYAGGDLFYTDIAQAKRGVELDLTVAMNAEVANWYRDHYRTLNTRQNTRDVWLYFDGDNSKEFALGISGALIEYGELSEREGQDIVRVKYTSQYNESQAAINGLTSDRDMGVFLRYV